LNYYTVQNDICVEENVDFDLEKTLFCGQCFRFKQLKPNIFSGVVLNKHVIFLKVKNKIYFKNVLEKDFKNIWFKFFDFKRNYSKIFRKIIDVNPDLMRVAEFSRGIRILKQHPWEVLCSFIFSQNNNIPRISKIIKNFCQRFGKEISPGNFSFPLPEDLKNLALRDLDFLKSGFRAKYIIDALEKLTSKKVILKDLEFKSTKEARNILMTIKGVGPKVADCTLLYGFGRFDAFPIDTWVAKSLNIFFKKVKPEVLKNLAGLAQQYIFYYMRSNSLIYKTSSANPDVKILCTDVSKKLSKRKNLI
jgi:N-glycosylase/DNA lyase